MTYTVDKSIPPPPMNETGRAVKYPLAEMQVGDSFRFAWDAALRSAIRSNAYQKWGSARMYTTKMVEEDGKRYFRIWRIK